jgi:hypothetical protein
MAGYTRADTGNNIADGNVINSNDLDAEYDAIEAAFNSSTGHTHDGTSAEGAPIEKVGPVQDLVVTATEVKPKTDNTLDLGTATLEFKDLYIDGTANIDSLVADTADINGGTIDGVTIGGASAGAGTFTTITGSGDMNIDSGTLFVDVSENRVGIGTTSPSVLVEASKSQNAVTDIKVTNANTGTAAQARLTLGNSGSNIGALGFLGGSFTTSGVYRQDGVYVYSNGVGGLTLLTGAAQPIYFATNSAERMRITSGGTLQIAGGGNDNVGEINMGNTAQNANRFQVRHQSSAWYLKTVDSEPLVFGTANTERMRLDSSGNVGIGTASADELLHLAASSGATIRFESTTTGATTGDIFGAIEFETQDASSAGIKAKIDAYSEGGVGNTALRLFTGDTTGLYQRLNIASNGDISFYEDTGTTPKLFWDASEETVSIGASTSTGDPLLIIHNEATVLSTHIASNGSLQGKGSLVNVRNDSSTNGAFAGLEFNTSRSGGTEQRAFIVANAEATGFAPSIVFGQRTASGAMTERLRINSSGNVGIGTASPATIVHLAETGASDEPTLLIQSENSSIYLRTAGSSGSFPTGGGGNDGELLYIGGDFRVGVGSASKNLIFMNGSSYTERMRIDSSGRVGIGTSSPANMLHLSNTSEGTHDLAFNRNTTYGASTGLGGVSWYNQAGDTKLTRIESQTDGAATNTRLIFSTASSGTLTERMRLDASGSLGIGTTNPASKLTVDVGASLSFNASATDGQEGSSATIQVLNANGAANSFTQLLFRHTNASDNSLSRIVSLNSGTSSALAFVTESAGTPAERLRINSSGSVGIGTSSPTGLLDLTVGQAKTATSGVTFAQLGKSNEASNYASLQCRVVGAASAANRSWEFQTIEQGIANAGNIVFQNDGGKVGIGTTSPASLLDVNGGASASIVTLSTTSGNPGARIHLLGSPSSFKNWAIGASAVAVNGALEFVPSTTNGGSTFTTPAMIIDSSGNLLVGTTTVGTKSGDTVIGFGPNGGIISKQDTSVADDGTVDIAINTSGGGYQGFLIVSNTRSSSANYRTHTTFSVFGRGTDSSIQQIATDNGTSGGASFTVTTPSNGVIRVTNTHGETTSVNIQFFGGNSS